MAPVVIQRLKIAIKTALGGQQLPRTKQWDKSADDLRRQLLLLRTARQDVENHMDEILLATTAAEVLVQTQAHLRARPARTARSSCRLYTDSHLDGRQVSSRLVLRLVGALSFDST